MFLSDFKPAWVAALRRLSRKITLPDPKGNIMNRADKLLCRLLGLGVACATAILSASSVHGQTPVTLETIAKAWQDRQDSIRSARFAWIERETVPKGRISSLIAELPGAQDRLKHMGIAPGAIVPPEDTTHDVPASITLDGEKLRYERAQQQWSGKQNAFVTLPRITVFDGTVGKIFHPTGPCYAPWPDGLIGRNYPDSGSLHLSPLIMTLRPSFPRMNIINIQTMSLTGRRVEINGRPCLEMESQLGNYVQRVWVDLSRDYVVVRSLGLVNEQVRTKIDIGYRQDTKKRWVPEKWDILTLLPNGKLESSGRATVMSYELNATVELAAFDIKFPPGTRVTDTRDPKSQVNYILKEGDKKRMIMPEEIGATYEQMINSEPGEARGKRARSFFSWPVAVASGITVVAGGLLFWRIVNSRKQRT